MVVSHARRRIKKDNPCDIPTEASEKPEVVDPKPSTEFKCQHVGRFANPICEKYYYCWDTTGDHAILSCPHHKAFDPKTKRCVHNFAVCSAAPKCEFDRQLLPNPFEKSSYLQCSHISSSSARNVSDDQYRLYKKICANKGEFDAVLGYCKLTVENSDDSLESNDSANQVECKEAGVFIDRTNDSRYYECSVKSVKYTKIHQTCPNDRVFSMEEKRCIKLDSNEK